MGLTLGAVSCMPGFDPGCYGPTQPPELIAEQLTVSDFVSLGDTLREMNAKIKRIVEAIGRRPAGMQVPLELAQAIHSAQLQYDDLRGKYTYVYRAIWGSVPAGLGALPIVPVSLVVVVVAGMYALARLIGVADNALSVWTENIRSGVVLGVPEDQRASVAASIYGTSSGDFLSNLPAWLENNLTLAAAGLLGVVVLLRR